MLKKLDISSFSVFRKRSVEFSGGKPAAWMLIISVLAVILLSVCLLTNPELNPVPNPAQKLEVPDPTSVLSMEMEQINEGTSIGRTTVKDSEDIRTVLFTLSGARKTLMQSVNDNPTQKNYLIVRLVLEREKKTLYLYTQGNGYYVEEPYIGVYKYKSDKETNAEVYEIYNDRLSGATPSPVPLTLDDVRELARKWKNIKKGTPREVVLKIMGAPDFTLSGLYGDGYVLEDGSAVVFYYSANELVYDIKK